MLSVAFDEKKKPNVIYVCKRERERERDMVGERKTDLLFARATFLPGS